jgi:lipopolysaccharide export system protein LptC
MTPNRPMPMRSWLALIGLSLLALGIFSVLERLEKQAKRERVVNLPPIDYTFEGIQYAALDSNGDLRVRVNAQRMTHTRADKSLLLSAPHIVRFGADTAQQTLNAERAQVYDQGKRVELRGNVEMLSRAQSATAKAETHINTADLTLLAEEKRAFTDSAVQIQQGDTVMTGRGLRADFNQQLIEIEHDIHTVYRPSTR